MIGLIVLTVFAALLGAALLWSVMIYNGLIKLKNNIEKAFSNIDVLLKQRFDEIPNLVQVCKGYMEHERQTLESLIEARSRAGRGVQSEGQLSRQGELTDALGRLFMVVENYPALKADTNFLRLSERISQIEDMISDRREFYNESVNLYNIRIEQVPDVLVARFFNFARREPWRAEAAHRQSPSVTLR